jgi:hypothetical protein
VGRGRAGRGWPHVEPAEDALVGRADEVAVMRGLVAGVAAGRGGAAWVDGEPGIGKSALLGDARRHGPKQFRRIVPYAAGFDAWLRADPRSRTLSLAA